MKSLKRPFTRRRRPRDPAKRSGVAPVRRSEFGRLGILNSGLRVGARFPSLAAELSLFPGPPAPKITIISSSTQISSASLPLNCNLSWAQSFNLELNRKCRGAAPPRAGGNPFSEGEAVRHTQSAIMIGSPSQGWRRWTGRPQSFEPRAGHPGQKLRSRNPEKNRSECLYRSTSRPLNACCLGGSPRNTRPPR